MERSDTTNPQSEIHNPKLRLRVGIGELKPDES
jgi:hypothetical protein